jgi:hypothetical protein
VVLLSKGAMIARDTPQQTIDFYMRQIGEEKGLHTFRAGATEAIFCNGRLSLFQDAVEISASSGLQLQVFALGSLHPSTSAEWRVTDARPDGCTASGRMLRLPLVHHWDVQLRDGKVVWTAELEAERDVMLEGVEMYCFLPTAYIEWHYGDLDGAFPPIEPGDTKWTPVIAPESSTRSVAALPEPGSGRPCMGLTVLSSRDDVRLAWSNTDYISAARALQCGARFPEGDNVLPAGRHRLMTLEFDLAAGHADLGERLEARRAERGIVHGALWARFDHGCIHLIHRGEELTRFLHVYTSMLIGNLWNDSHGFLWEAVTREADGRLRMAGASRRFPFRQVWRLAPADGGFHFAVELEALDTLTVQEHHASVVLRPEYDRWATDHESGAFPPFEPGRQEWRHANRDYAPGGRIVASGPGLPAVAIEAGRGDLPLRMTAIATGFDQNAHVLQALRTPDAGLLTFAPGVHPYFDGVIRVDATEKGED